MTSTPPTAPTGNTKPTLTGSRIKQRKGAVKSQAKFEPEAFRNALYKYFDTIQPGDWDGYLSSLDKAGNTLDYRKYTDQLFEILIVGGLLAPGGSYIDDGAPMSPFSIFAAKSDSLEDVRPYVEVIEKMIRRYKFLQKPLEETSMKGILQYINRYEPVQVSKLAVACALSIQMGLTNASILAPLQKDHLTKDDLALNFITKVFRTYLQDQSMEHLASTLRKGGIRDWLLFFPQTKRSQPDVIPNYFRSPEVDLQQVAEYYARRQTKELREQTTLDLANLVENQESSKEDILTLLKERQTKLNASPEEFVVVVFEGIMRGIDAETKQDQLELIVPKEVERFASVLEPFASTARAEIALINAIQLHCYTDTRVFKSFPTLLKILYNENVLSDGAIIYWAQKGAKPQGKQHFLKLAEPLVEFLEQQDSDDDDDE
ncbi:hypothetical protein MPSI1_003475 [Malassezia psittaci]|uniref:W2 domain-containing protein n=1 Tax=Malassezia psittaci TaxID=1821823 RepID=A0AAF0JFW2_9BASI|nr:hypothetical protein MPSI1_003475 [Malassezia psittaci]